MSTRDGHGAEIPPPFTGFDILYKFGFGADQDLKFLVQKFICLRIFFVIFLLPSIPQWYSLVTPFSISKFCDRFWQLANKNYDWRGHYIVLKENISGTVRQEVSLGC